MQQINKRNSRVWSMLGMRRTVGNLIPDLVKTNPNFMFVTADVARYFGIEKYYESYPDNIMDLGIAEQNLVGFSAGMASEGINVFAATYASFVTARTLDQIRVSLSYMNLGVKLIGVGGGLAEGDLSATHMGLEDIGLMRMLPNMTVVCPADATEAVKVMEFMAEFDGPAYIRLTGKENIPMIYTDECEFVLGKANVLKEGNDVAIIGSGTIIAECIKAASILQEKGISCSVADMHTIKPLDVEYLKSILNVKLIVTVEEHMISGGLGGAVAEELSQCDSAPRLIRIGVDDYYPNATEYDILLRKCGIKSDNISERIFQEYYG